VLAESVAVTVTVDAFADADVHVGARFGPADVNTCPAVPSPLVLPTDPVLSSQATPVPLRLEITRPPLLSVRLPAVDDMLPDVSVMSPSVTIFLTTPRPPDTSKAPVPDVVDSVVSVTVTVPEDRVFAVIATRELITPLPSTVKTIGVVSAVKFLLILSKATRNGSPWLSFGARPMLIV
jgi:hypothetical protein